MKFQIGDVFNGWNIIRTIYANDYREVYAGENLFSCVTLVLDCNNKVKEYYLIILLKPEIDNSFNFKAFSPEDMIINAIPELQYRDFHGIIFVWDV